jgi:small subunit ribosomal protein S8
MDTIADMLTRIRNAKQRKIKEIEIPYFRLNFDILKILKAENFIREVESFKNEDNNLQYIRVELLYEDKEAKIKTLKRVSKPSRRIYKSYRDLKKILNGFGIAIISTSQGIMTDKEARKKKLGGEVLCEIY